MIVKELESLNPRTIKATQVGENVVSTVLLDSLMRPLDDLLGMFPIKGRADLHAPGDYETMVFSCDSEGEITDFTEKDFARYSTAEEAVKGHDLMVENWSQDDR